MTVNFREVTHDDLDKTKDPALAVLNDMLRQLTQAVNNIESAATSTSKSLTSNSLATPVPVNLNASLASVTVGPGTIGFSDNTNQKIVATPFQVARPSSGSFFYYFAWNPTTLNVEVDGPYVSNTAANKIPSNTGKYLIVTVAVP